MKYILYNIIKMVGRPIYKILYRPRYIGVNNIPKKGAVILAGNHTSQYNILLSHDPLFYEFYSEYDFDMILSGHVHGGVINTPFGGLLSPDFTFFPEYYRGNNKIKNTNLIISRGLGYGNALKIRVFNNPEVVVAKLMKNNW